MSMIGSRALRNHLPDWQGRYGRSVEGMGYPSGPDQGHSFHLSALKSFIQFLYLKRRTGDYG
jgi:hypothetical protein